MYYSIQVVDDHVILWAMAEASMSPLLSCVSVYRVTYPRYSTTNILPKQYLKRVLAPTGYHLRAISLPNRIIMEHTHNNNNVTILQLYRPWTQTWIRPAAVPPIQSTTVHYIPSQWMMIESKRNCCCCRCSSSLGLHRQTFSRRRLVRSIKLHPSNHPIPSIPRESNGETINRCCVLRAHVCLLCVAGGGGSLRSRPNTGCATIAATTTDWLSLYVTKVTNKLCTVVPLLTKLTHLA